MIGEEESLQAERRQGFNATLASETQARFAGCHCGWGRTSLFSKKFLTFPRAEACSVVICDADCRGKL